MKNSPLKEVAPSNANDPASEEFESGVVVAARDSSRNSRRRLPLLDVEGALAAQRSLTAVDRFSLQHESLDLAEGDTYRALIPLARPKPGEQYAFEVDLDACTGCKACVAACHTLNGLDPGETFRTVGLLTGGNAREPRIQTVTSSCHHCLEPACLSGCPVSAYEKDPVTGIVRHLDDQCFGCQYCTLMCPYDAPKYNEEKGIVRKCDMCSDRLAHGEAPACVQACPNDAIAIRIVENAVVAAAADARHFVRGAADRDGTLPTSTYKTTRATPDNLLPVDYYRLEVAPAHLPLVAMLTLSQWAVGLLGMGVAVQRWFAYELVSLTFAATAAGILGLALLASLLHLGRPWLAYRAVLGLRTSWLSREVLAFGVAMKLALLTALTTALPSLPQFPGRALLEVWQRTIVDATAAAGLGGVFCSVMVYAATRRGPWALAPTAFRFFGTTLLLGAAGALVFATRSSAHASATSWLLQIILVVSLLKLGFDASLLREAASRRFSGQKRVGLVMLGELRAQTALRAAMLFAAGVVAPVALLATSASLSATLALPITLLLLTAELFERHSFFAAAPTLRMPGSLR